MSIYNNKKELLDLLTIEENFLYGDFSDKFSEKKILKKNGDERIINPPIKKLKEVQRVILDKILKMDTVLPCVYGLSFNKNIIENAKLHQKNANSYILLLDIKDFFPSVKYKDVNNYYTKIGFSKENAKILTKLSTFQKIIPQGSPSSCHIASFCLESLDKNIYSYCLRNKFIYSRYIDDITISGNDITQDNIGYISNLITRKGYVLNHKKDLLLPNQKKIINNILVSIDKIIVPEKYIEEIKESFEKYKKYSNEFNYAKFMGKLGFFIHVNKEEAIQFKNKLIQ